MKKLLTFLTLLTLFFTTAWAAETVYYTLDGTITGGNNGYATESDITQNDMSWKVTGNTTENPWRIGGKSINQEDRPIYSTTQMGNAISKVTVQLGTIGITLVHVQLIVASDANFNNKIQTQSKTANANSTIEFTPAEGEWPSGAYYKLNFMVTNTSSSNKYLQFIAANFYKNEASVVNAPTFSPAEGNYDEPQNVTISTTTDGATIYYTTDDSDPTTSSSVYSSPIAVSTTTTIKAIAVKSGMTNSAVASATYTFPNTVPIPYEEAFAGTFGDFYKKDVTGTNIWTKNSGYAKASGYSGGATAAEGWLISPYINLTNASNPELSFSHAGNYFNGTANMQSDVAVKVKKQGDATWSDLNVNTWPDGASWDFVDNTTSLADYAGETIQIAFVYTSTTSRAGTWEIKNFKVKNVDTSAPSYYLVGSFNMNGNDWVIGDNNYKFEESNGTYTLNNVNFPDANTTFKVIKIENNQVTWYGGTGDVNYNIHHRHHTNLPMNGGKDYTIQSAGLTSFSFTLDNNTPTNLNVNRTASLAIKGDFTNNWTEVPMTASANGWTTTQTVAVDNKFGFMDEFGQYIGILWTVGTEHLGTDIPMTTENNNEQNGDYKMGIAGTYKFTANSDLTTLVITAVTGDTYTLVESADDLDENSQYVLFSKGSNNQTGRVMSTTRQTNNIKGSTTETVVANKQIIAPDDAQIITLVSTTATVDGDDVDAWFLSVGDGYLYAASSSSNHMKVWSTTDDKCKATISINGAAEIIFRGDYSHNVLRYNTNDNLYSCYESGKQDPVYLYKKSSVTPPSDQVATPTFNPGSADSSSPYIVYGGKQEITINCATSGATIYYTTDGSTPTTSSNQYSEPFDLTSTGGNVTVKAIAVKADLDDSEIATSYYRFTNPNPPTFNPASGTVHNDAFNVTISSEYEDAVIYYMLDPASAPTAAQMSESGTLYESPVNVSGEGPHTIYAMVERNGIKSSVVNATYTITSGTQPSGDGDYVKVTNAADLTDGEYLIVYEMEGTPIENGIVFDGSLSNLDTKPNSISEVVEINNFTIASSTEVDAAIFTITSSENGYSIKSASDKYIGGTSGSNTMTSSDDVIYNSISFDEDGNADIISNTSHLRYNTSDTRFRYFKSSSYASQQPIALYKKVEKPVDEPTSVTLAELCQNGVITEGENWYVISDKLIAVYADATKGILWCKDMGNASIFSTSIKDGQVDFLKDDPQAQNGRDWDQSNWIALHFTTPTSTNNIGLLVSGAVNRYIKPGTVKGKLIDEVNYALMMDLDQLELVTQADDPDINPNYIPNVYCPANFMPTNLNIWGNDEDGGYTTGSDQNYFFMNPKIQEICEVTYAQWDAINGYFTVPTSSGFDGAFYIGTGYNVIQSQNFTSSLQDEHIYRFKAIVQRSDKDNYGPKNVTTPATGITLYPVDLDPSENGGSDITTAINTVETGNGEVKSVKYVNVAGMVSDVPFQGVNIVVTEYTDGSRTTSKMLKK